MSGWAYKRNKISVSERRDNTYLRNELKLTYQYILKTSFEKNCFSAWASTLNMGLINKVDMVCLSPVGYGV